MKELLKSTVISIGISLAIFCIIGIVFDVIFKGNFSMTNYSFTKMVIGCVLTGIGFGAPTVIYKKDTVPRPIQMIIHLGLGCTVYTVVAFSVGWIPVSLGVAKCALIAAGMILLSVLIWLGFMLFYRKEAKAINEKIKQI